VDEAPARFIAGDAETAGDVDQHEIDAVGCVKLHAGRKAEAEQQHVKVTLRKRDGGQRPSVVIGWINSVIATTCVPLHVRRRRSSVQIIRCDQKKATDKTKMLEERKFRSRSA